MKKMSKLDERLREIQVKDVQIVETFDGFDTLKETSIALNDDAIAQIKQVYADEVLPKTDKLMQDMVNLHANMKHDMLRLGLTPSDPRLMTGQAFYDRLMKEFLKVNRIYETPEQDDWIAKFSDFVEAARKAAGLEEK